jgi:hypothetical protein
MKVIVDTSVWSLALRRHNQDLSLQEQKIVTRLTEIISENRVVMLGPVRQEILSGIVQESQFQQLKNTLSAFTDLDIKTADYEFAAELFNTCRGKGITATHTDLLICALAKKYSFAVFTTDQDFFRLQEIIGFELI